MMVRYLKNGNTVFSFYDQHGFPGFWKVSPEYKQAFKALKPDNG
ncbi:membrane protein [Salmonella enterica subsp. enterica]|nr:membrane protein [Salmonella enterica subsp. enterica]